MSDNEICKRYDIRNKRVFSIDPKGAKDLDDALSIEKIDENKFRVGIHIADVSYFVDENSALEREVTCSQFFKNFVFSFNFFE